MTDPISVKGHFFEYFKALFNNEKEKLKKLQSDFIEKSEKNSQKTFENSFSIHSSNNYKSLKSESLLKEYNMNLSQEEINKKIKNLLKNKKIIYLVVYLSLKLGPLLYFTDNYKLISFKILKSDQKISLALALSSIFATFGQLTIIPIWKKLNFFKTHILLSFLSLSILAFYLFFAINSQICIILCIIYNRIITKMVYGSINFTKFGIFHPKVAIGISKLIDSCYFFSMIFATTFNYFFFSEEDVTSIFWIFVGFNFVSFLGFCGLYKDFVKEVE